MRATLSPRSAVLSLLLAIALSSQIPASDLPDSVKGFQRQSLEVYLDRADQEKASSSWEQVAQFGAEAAIAQWERDATLLYPSASEMEQARAQLTNWAGAEIQGRFESWLLTRFFGQQGSLGMGAVQQAISQANLQYLYTTDASGVVQVDENGDPILKGAADAETDRAAWKARVGEAEDAALSSWEQRVDEAFAPAHV